MTKRNRTTVLVLSLPPYRYATRGRKAAAAFARSVDTVFLGLEAAGRSGRRDVPGHFNIDGVKVHQIRIGTLRTSTSVVTQISNLLTVYLPAFVRLLRSALSTEAELVHVTHPTLSLIGALHRRRFGSRIVLDIPERPGLMNSPGSGMSTFSRIEPALLRWMSARVATALVVVPTDVAVVQRLGFQSVRLVRNVPLASWRATYRDPPRLDSAPLEAVIISSVFEGRGFEIVLRAIALCNRESQIVNLRIYGPSSARYQASLERLSAEIGTSSSIIWGGNLETSEVSDTYLSAHIGLVLYEPNNPGNDGLSNKILECVSSGRPVLAGNLPENRAFVSANNVGWLSEVTEEALAAALATIANEADMTATSRRCRLIGDEQLTWESEFAPVVNLATSL